ncbi:MAG: hypothetical protein ABR599_10170, partial [Gemmatimonadota bacterium]
ELGGEGAVVLHLMDGAGDAGEVRLRLETPLAKVALLPDVLRDLELKRLGFDTLDLSFADQIVVRPVPLAEIPAPPPDSLVGGAELPAPGSGSPAPGPVYDATSEEA